MTLFEFFLNFPIFKANWRTYYGAGLKKANQKRKGAALRFKGPLPHKTFGVSIIQGKG